MSRHPLPDAALKGHIAVVGMTGGGKTFTAKGIVEHILECDPTARVCILDPIKSDWWGVTSSADGRKPGLPFHILGGPRGHGPLHESSGKAIGELVGSGALQLSIVDMADFGPGGLQTFFNDFAPALLRRIRGVVYLVLEEAHEFAPKERAGFGGETMTVHFAKKLATAGRSMGVRIIAATQRTQQLHNSVLGSCQTVIAHQLTYPADIEPVSKWFKGHVDKVTFARFSETLTSLPTGTGWLCSGQAKVAEMVQFPRIWTFDNSATPESSEEIDVKMAPVDREKLRAIVGDAVAEAEANDPAKLRAEIARLQRELSKTPASATNEATNEAARQQGWHEGYAAGLDRGIAEATGHCRDALLTQARRLQDLAQKGVLAAAEEMQSAGQWTCPRAAATPLPGITHARQPFTPAPSTAPAVSTSQPAKVSTGTQSADLIRGERTILTVLAQYSPQALDKGRLGAIAGFASKGGSFRTYVGRLKTLGYVERDALRITQAGLNALGPYDPMPTGRALLDHWCARLIKGEREILTAIANAGGEASRDEIGRATGFEPSGGSFRTYVGKLKTLGLVTGSNPLLLHEDLR